MPIFRRPARLVFKRLIGQIKAVVIGGVVPTGLLARATVAAGLRSGRDELSADRTITGRSEARHDSEQVLHEDDVEPATKLKSHLPHMGDGDESKFLVQDDATLLLGIDARHD